MKCVLLLNWTKIKENWMTNWQWQTSTSFVLRQNTFIHNPRSDLWLLFVKLRLSVKWWRFLEGYPEVNPPVNLQPFKHPPQTLQLLPSEGWRCHRSPDRGQSPVWRRVILSHVVHLCGCAAVVHGGTSRGRCSRVSQAVVVSAGAAEKMGAQVVVRPSVLGRSSHGGVADRPQAGVLTARKNREETCPL